MPTSLPSNRVKHKLQAAQTAVVLSGHVNSADLIDFVGPLGFDGYWLEGEHGPVDFGAIGHMSRACDLWGLSSIMRVHANEPGLIGRTLDRGVNGIVVPHVNNRAEAERVVQAALFHPHGRRGIFNGRRSFGDPDYIHNANRETLIVVLIEEMQAVENLAEILSVDHIDVFFVAPGDLSQSMGLPMQMDHPQVVSVVEEAIRQIVAAGRVAGALAFDHGLAHYIDLGARFLLTTYDPWLTASSRSYLNEVRRLTTPDPTSAAADEP